MTANRLFARRSDGVIPVHGERFLRDGETVVGVAKDAGRGHQTGVRSSKRRARTVREKPVLSPDNLCVTTPDPRKPRCV